MHWFSASQAVTTSRNKDTGKVNSIFKDVHVSLVMEAYQGAEYVNLPKQTQSLESLMSLSDRLDALDWIWYVLNTLSKP